MRIHDIAFYSAGFFLIGVFLFSLELNFLIIAWGTVLMALLFSFIGYFKEYPRSFWLAGLSLITIIGALYAGVWEIYQYKRISIPFDQDINFSGIVAKNPERGNSQKLVLELQQPYSGRILANLRPHPEFDYGDSINFEGAIKRPDEKSANYYAKDRIFGITAFPGAELISRNNGSAIKTTLLGLKNKTTAIFQKALVPERAAFLSGITLGERGEFRKELKDAMSRSGTTHLVALSGYNVSILAWTIGLIFGWFLSRRSNFIVSALFIIAFVLMTGAEASVVRAAIMGTILLLAGQVSRIYSLRNAITLAAFFMVLTNPKVLNFDIGFQLSFLALLGIVYLAPALQKLLKLRETAGFFSWRENFTNTFSAQLSVAPILIMNFGGFSITSLLANVLILSFIPLTMTLGFILGALGFFSYPLSLIFGWFVNFLIFYELSVIKFFGSLSILTVSSIDTFWVVIYYLSLLGVVIWGKSKKSSPVPNNLK